MTCNSMSCRLLVTALIPAALSAQNPASHPVQFAGAYFAKFHPDTAYDMILHVPGFAFSAGDSTLRGIGQASGNVVVDGRRLADKDFTLEQLLQHISADQVDHIEVIRGSGSGIDMLGQPIVANVVRRSAKGASGAVTVTDGIFADGRTTPSVTLEGTHTFSSGKTLAATLFIGRYVETSKGDGHRNRFSADGKATESAAVRARSGGTTGYGQGAFETPLAGGQMRLDGSVTWTDYRDRQTDTTNGPIGVVTRYFEDLGGPGGGQANAEAGVHYSRSFGAGVTSETTFLLRRGWKDYDSLFEGPASRTTFSERDRTRETVARAKVHYSATSKLAAEFTGEFALNRLYTESALKFEEFPIALPNADAIIDETRFDGGADLVWLPCTPFQLTAGLHAERSTVRARADDPRRHLYTFLKPALRGSYTLATGTMIRSRIEREVGQLQFTDFIAVAALDKGAVSTSNGEIAPQHDWVAEASVEQKWGSGAAVVATYSHSWVKDVVDWIPVTGSDGTVRVDARGNIGDGRLDKWVVSGNSPLDSVGLPKSEINFSVTVSSWRVRDPITRDARGKSDQKPVVVTAGFQQELPRRRATWGFTYASPTRTHIYRFNEIDLETTGSELDLFADYHPGSRSSVRLDVKDALRQDYGRVITSYLGVRSPQTSFYLDRRSLRSGPSFSVRLRRRL